MLRTSLALLFALALTTAAFGQVPDPLQSAALMTPGRSVASMQLSAAPATATATCTYQFTIPATAMRQYLQYCVTVNGNIVEFQSPAGSEHIAFGMIGEGYSVCDITNVLRVGYLDYAGYGDFDTGHWGAPTLLSQTATQVKIARTTTDGNFTLNQTFLQTTADSSVKVTMALTNNTGITRQVWLARFADVDAESNALNTGDGTFNTAFAYLGSPFKGMQLSLAAANPFTHNGFAVPSINTACNLTAGFSGTLVNADVAIGFYNVMTIKAGKSASFSFKYKGI